MTQKESKLNKGGLATQVIQETETLLQRREELHGEIKVIKEKVEEKTRIR